MLAENRVAAGVVGHTGEVDGSIWDIAEMAGGTGEEVAENRVAAEVVESTGEVSEKIVAAEVAGSTGNVAEDNTCRN